MKTLKLIVQYSDNCKKILIYVHDHIQEINRLGVKIRIERFTRQEMDADAVDLLCSKGITRLPALVLPDKTILIGTQRITDLFQKNLQQANITARVGGGTSLPSGGNLDDFWRQELYDRDGKPSTDEEPDPRADCDFDRQLRNYQQAIPRQRASAAPGGPGGRRGSMLAEIEAELRRDGQLAPGQPSPRGDNVVSRTRREEPDDGGADDSNYGVAASAARIGRGDDALDQRMMAAWMDNNPTT